MSSFGRSAVMNALTVTEISSGSWVSDSAVCTTYSSTEHGRSPLANCLSSVPLPFVKVPCGGKSLTLIQLSVLSPNFNLAYLVNELAAVLVEAYLVNELAAVLVGLPVNELAAVLVGLLVNELAAVLEAYLVNYLAAVLVVGLPGQ